MIRRFDAAIVDLDGTMIDTLGDFEVALNRTLADLALPSVDRAFIERTIGKGSEHLIRSTLHHVLGSNQALARMEYASNAINSGVIGASVMDTSVMDAHFEHAWSRYQHHYQQVNGQASAVFPGVHEGLDALRAAGLALACLTNKPASFARPLLDAKGLTERFAHIFGGDSFALKKPDPLPLLKTCEALGTAPERTLMIGDSSNDAQAAHAAGCPVILMTYGYNHGADIRAVQALAHLDSMRGLAAWL